jgi:phospholipase/carboxylesterase
MRAWYDVSFGAIALQTGLRHPDTLAGVMALSSYLPLVESLPQEAPAANKEPPIFIAHGLYDPVVPLKMGTASMTLLVGLGYSIEWHPYPMPHSVCRSESFDLSPEAKRSPGDGPILQSQAGTWETLSETRV